LPYLDMRERLRRSDRPNRIFATVIEAARTAGLIGRKRVLADDYALPTTSHGSLLPSTSPDSPFSPHARDERRLPPSPWC
jgi:hypothetical protein